MYWHKKRFQDNIIIQLQFFWLLLRKNSKSILHWAVTHRLNSELPRVLWLVKTRPKPSQTPDQSQLIVSCPSDGSQFRELSVELSACVGHCWVSYGKFLRLQRHVTLSRRRCLRVCIGIFDFGSLQFCFELSEKQVWFPLRPPHRAGKQSVVITQTHTHQPLLIGSSLWGVREWAFILLNALAERVHHSSRFHVELHRLRPFSWRADRDTGWYQHEDQHSC